MINKKLGIVMIVLSILIAIVILNVIGKLSIVSRELECLPVNSECSKIESFFSILHVAIGIVTFLFALGIYLLFFSKGEEAILKRLEEEKTNKIEEEKFKIILMALGAYEKRVLKAVKEQDGITQNTLRIRTDMSKAKLSYVLQELEKRNLVKRVRKGKTLAVFLKI